MDEHPVDRNPFLMALGRLGPLLARLADERTRDRGALAALRKGIGAPDGWHPATAMVLDRAIGDVRLGATDEEVLYLTAALFSLHPEIAAREEGAYPPSLLRSLARLMDIQGRSTDDRAAIDRRVLALLNADRADLFHHLRHLVSLFRNSGVGIDWVRLARDLRAWNRADRRVQRQWARDWWSAPPWTTDQTASREFVVSGSE